MLSQVLRTRQHISICQSQLHRRFSTFKPTSTSTTEEVIPASRSAFIRTWEPFHNVADAWALLRVVERKYGKVAEAQFLKDFEMKNRYQVFAYVLFHDQESLQRVPKEGHTFYIPAPVIENKPGGIGLDDIRHLLNSTDRDESFEFPSAASLEIKDFKERMIGARIERATKDFYTLPKIEKSIKPNNVMLARLFLNWAGFHKLEPMEKSRDITEKEWFEGSEVEQVRMRSALQWCSKLTFLANPAVIPKPKQVSDSSLTSASMDSSESSSPVTLDIPISHKSTSISAQSPLRTKSPQLPSQSSPGSTQPPPQSTSAPLESRSAPLGSTPAPLESTPAPLGSTPAPLESTPAPLGSTPAPPESTPAPLESTLTPPGSTFLPLPGQLTPEQMLAKKAMQRQMSRAKQFKVKAKRPAKGKGPKPEGKTPEDRIPPKVDESLKKPPSPPPQPKGILASIWKLLGR